MILPHGGKLINRVLPSEKREEILAKISGYKSLVLDIEQVKDAKNIARGAYSPLKGFLKEGDFLLVVKDMRLQSGIVWPIPIVLDTDDKEFGQGDFVVLKNDRGEDFALLKEPEVFEYDKKFFAENVFQTLDTNHPGVADIFAMKKYLLGGEVILLEDKRDFFPDHNFFPQETREIFKSRAWEKIVAFQTRNVPHRGHEFLQKEALKVTDGLFIQPVIGKKKVDDFKDEYILTAYEILIDKYYSRKRVVLGILPLKMRYAGPREAIFHAIIRKNYGCSHFIVGRDHAGVGNYYGPSDAQNIFDQFEKDEIGVEILKFPEVVYCSSVKEHTFIHQSPKEDAVSFSGTKLRGDIKQKVQPPDYIIRPEIYGFLANSYNSLVDDMYNNQKNHKQAFVIWLTGLCQSGKTTIADKLHQELIKRGVVTERLDGDIVRQHLSKGLGFSKEDRDENIRRVGFVSKLLARNGVGVISSFVSPYNNVRNKIREDIETPSLHRPEAKPAKFVEVYCKCPVEVCESRDSKGLYKKAREGEIQNFTGVSDPYEEPENPEVILFTDNEGVEECAQKIIKYLEENNLIQHAA